MQTFTYENAFLSPCSFPPPSYTIGYISSLLERHITFLCAAPQHLHLSCLSEKSRWTLLPPGMCDMLSLLIRCTSAHVWIKFIQAPVPETSSMRAHAWRYSCVLWWDSTSAPVAGWLSEYIGRCQTMTACAIVNIQMRILATWLHWFWNQKISGSRVTVTTGQGQQGHPLLKFQLLH